MTNLNENENDNEKIVHIKKYINRLRPRYRDKYTKYNASL